ncbi:hypothetical protein B0T11DRAFT_294192 [Plectosphaerella cucumerina]|uniref:Uncharacterized protein n=1 Tax=Plectosphaerella cucumerina TaxID=40658 RepID=A0A8K0X985_9PEZI|nr:hypothetical protein B0T11DRAFT_294192 [Plectosphaerella cucumerina]
MSTTQTGQASPLPSGQRADPSPTTTSQGKHDGRSPIRNPASVQGNRGFRRKVMVRETISGKKRHSTVGSTIFQVLFTPEEVLRMGIFFAMDETSYVVRDVKSWRAQRRAAAAAQAEEQEQKTGAPSAAATDKDASTTISESITSEEAPPSLREFLSEKRKLMAQDVRAWYDVWKQGKEVGRKSIALLEATIQRRLENISCPRCHCGPVSPAAAQNTTSNHDGGEHAHT